MDRQVKIRSGTGEVGLEGNTEEVGVKDTRADTAGCETAFSLRGASRLARRGGDDAEFRD